MYVGLYAICVWNWNWWLTQDHFLIKHWNQRTHRCSAVRCWPWGVFIGAGQPLQHGEVRDTNLAWVRPVLYSALRYGRRDWWELRHIWKITIALRIYIYMYIYIYMIFDLSYQTTLGNQNAQLLSERPVHEYGTSNQGIKHGIVTIRSHFSDHRSQETVWIQSYVIP